MKLYLASFLEPDNFGPGRIIAIVNPSGGKPRGIKISSLFVPFTPKLELVNQYNKLRPIEPNAAGQEFVQGYREQLDQALSWLQSKAVQHNCSIDQLLPFENGDTLASWERANFTNYRKILGPYLEKMGFEVELH